MQKILENSKMSFNEELNMFWQDYFLQMWYVCKIRHFELIEHNYFIKWFLKMSFLPCSPFIKKFQNFVFLYDFVFHQVHSMNTYFHKRGHVFVIQKFEWIVWLYAFLLITLKRKYFRHLMILLYWTQNDIYIVSKLFKIFLLI
jgi:hypothetical protein